MADDLRLEAIRRAIRKQWHWAEDEGPAPLDDRLHLAKEFLGSILKAAGATEGIQEARLKEVWAAVAGDFVARHAAPASLKNGCLTLQVLQPSMRFHIEQMKGMLLKRLQESLGAQTVKTIRLSLG
jgi:predicted nucleic acid-binding Zn ribbon protein